MAGESAVDSPRARRLGVVPLVAEGVRPRAVFARAGLRAASGTFLPGQNSGHCQRLFGVAIQSRAAARPFAAVLPAGAGGTEGAGAQKRATLSHDRPWGHCDLGPLANLAQEPITLPLAPLFSLTQLLQTTRLIPVTLSP